MRLLFITSTPLNILEGSGTYAGISTLAAALRRMGVEVMVCAPARRFPVLTAQRIWFNERLSWARLPHADAAVGFDLDGYRIAGRTGVPHVASIKGVIADEMRFESGFTRWTMGLQARCEAIHLRRADLVMTTSRYAAGRLETLYRIPPVRSIVPELIDLEAWRELFRRNALEPDPAKFTVLTVCRFYPRKRLHLLLRAAARLRERIPGFEVRLVGNGPEGRRLQRLAADLRLGKTVRWLGDLSQETLAAEYKKAQLFCLPSVQEGFGIVFLEAMAAGLPIVAARAAAAPEVVPQGLLVEPESEAALADGIETLWRDPDLRARLRATGLEHVEQYDAPRVARQFLREVECLVARGERSGVSG